MDTEPLSIQATCDSGTFSTDIVVQVNGQAVATGSTNQVKPQVNMSGKYKDMTIDADCKSIKTGSMLHRECVVYVNGQKAAELSCR
jgi:hypothetical protein